MKTFSEIYQTACLHKGGEAQVEAMLPKPLADSQLIDTPDNVFLSMMSLRIFRAGLKHEMVDNKWPAFEEVFRSFDPFYCAMLSDDDLDTLMADKRIIRHMGKIKSVRENGFFVRDTSQQHNGFGRFLVEWPEEDIVGLWTYLKKHGKQLGGMSGPYFLRMVGKDTFLLTRDVVAVLINEGVVDKAPTSQAALKAAQSAFLTWKEESSRSYSEISRVLSYAAT